MAACAPGLTFEQVFRRVNGRLARGDQHSLAEIRARVWAHMRRERGGVRLGIQEIALACGMASHSTIVMAMRKPTMNRLFDGVGCANCGGYHGDDQACSPVKAMQPWTKPGETREAKRCDKCGDPTTAFTPDNEPRCWSCQQATRRVAG